jgi:hypothetical protein
MLKQRPGNLERGRQRRRAGSGRRGRGLAVLAGACLAVVSVDAATASSTLENRTIRLGSTYILTGQTGLPSRPGSPSRTWSPFAGPGTADRGRWSPKLGRRARTGGTGFPCGRLGVAPFGCAFRHLTMSTRWSSPLSEPAPSASFA